jgi:hypothetical protein
MPKEQMVEKKLVRLRSFLTKLSMVVASVLVALFIGEIILRLIGYSFPNFYTLDQDRGNALRPNAEGWYRKEGKVYVRINSQGLRDREHTLSKPPRTIRIAVLGDSYAEALQVPMENTFWYVMEQRLQNCPAFAGKKIEVINFGVSGYGTAQELVTLRQRVWDYSPDIVLLAVTTNNDITDNSRALKKTDEVPYFVYRDNQLVLDNSFQSASVFRWRQSALSRFGGWLADHLRIVQAMTEIQRAIKTRITSRQEPRIIDGAAQNNAALAGDVGIDNLIYREPDDETWRDAWRVTEGLIVLMRDEVNAHDAKFLVITESNGIQVHPDPATREDFMRRIGARDLFYPDLRIRALCEREGIPVLTLVPYLQSYAEQHKVFLHGFGKEIGNGHWNAEGHRVAGEIIADKLCEGLVD